MNKSLFKDQLIPRLVRAKCLLQPAFVLQSARSVQASRKLWIFCLISGLLVLLLFPTSALANPPSPLEPASFKTAQSKFLIDVTLWIALIVFIIVQGLLILAVVRFKQKDPNYIPKQVHGNISLEITWTIIPAIVFMIMFGLTWQTLKATEAPPYVAMQVNVTGHQWWWGFEYPDHDVVTGNELHIPVGEPIRIELNSDNVLHSFWIPQISGKMDVVPGRTNVTWIQADRPGEYRGICAELCGVQHANMNFTVVAHTQEDFDTWVAGQQTAPVESAEELAARGKTVFLANACIGCHTIEGTAAQAKTGPDLTHFASRRYIAALIDLENNPENLRLWLADPQALKPLNLMPTLNLNQEDLDALVAYLSSLE